MQRLVHVTEVVDKKAQVHSISEQPRDTFLLVLVTVALSIEHLGHVLDGPRDVEVLRVDRRREVVVHERLVNVMPRAEVIEANILNVVRESSALDKRVVLLVLVVLHERRQKFLSVGERLRRHLLELVVGNSGSCGERN